MCSMLTCYFTTATCSRQTRVSSCLEFVADSSRGYKLQTSRVSFTFLTEHPSKPMRINHLDKSRWFVCVSSWSRATVGLLDATKFGYARARYDKLSRVCRCRPKRKRFRMTSSADVRILLIFRERACMIKRWLI